MRQGVVAGAWLAPLGALWSGLALLQLAGGGAPEPLALAVGLSLLAGAPAFGVAAARGVVTLPTGLAALAGIAAAAAFGLGALRMETREVLELAGATAGLAALWAALGGGAGMGRAVGAGALLALALGPLLGGVGGALAGLGLGAGVAAVLAAAPAAMTEGRLRGAWPPALLGLVTALAVVAAPAVAAINGEGAAVAVLALLVALPGLGVVAASREGSPARLGMALLVLGALTAGLAIAVGSAPAAAGLIPAGAIGRFRFAVLGAAFLPVLAALLGALVARGAVVLAMAPLLLLATLSAAAPFALGGTAWQGFEGLAAPVLATALAAWLWGRG